MHIALCDDNPRDLKQIAKLLDKYAALHGLPMRIQMFSDAEDMLKAARKEGFTYYFLDVMMPCMNGIEAAQEIRSFDSKAKLVFLSSFSEYAYQGYRVKAYDYLLKPVSESQMFSLLDQIHMQEENTEDCICLQSGRSVFRIPYVRIAYLEVNQKRLYFMMADKQILQISGTMAEFERLLLSRPEFVKTHRSYIVNMNQISTLSPEGCTLFSGKSIPVSRLLYKQVREAYVAYLFGNMGV